MTVADDQAFQQFLDWLAKTAGKGGVQPLLDSYLSHLGELMSESEAEATMGTVLRMFNTRAEVWPILFDRIYSSEAIQFKTEPNALVVAAVEGLPAGSALDVAMGQGRNALFLASTGWNVTGIDVSRVGVETAVIQARASGVDLEGFVTDHESFDFGEGRWDLMVFCYAPVGVARSEMAERIGRGLKPGGRVVVESFASPSSQIRRRPVDIDPDDLREAFDRLDLLRFEEVEDLPDWDEAPQPMVRMIAARRNKTAHG
jgi:SAM-dependent methyltransferase